MDRNKEVIHVLPINDVKPHIQSKHCLCNPSIQMEGLLIVHNAYDGRDRVEKYNEELQL